MRSQLRARLGCGPAAVGRQDDAVDVDAVVTEQERDGGGERIGLHGVGQDCHGPRTRLGTQRGIELASMLVMVGPGATALTRMPLGPYMNALLLVSPATACFDAV